MDIRENKKEMDAIIREMGQNLAHTLPEWNTLVYTAGCRNMGGKEIITDMLFVRKQARAEFCDAFSPELRGQIGKSVLRIIGKEVQRLYELCGSAGDKWNQFTYILRNDGTFETFFAYPKPGKSSDPFSSENLDDWKYNYLQ